MPGVIDPETMSVDSLPGVWAPIQWEQTEQERAREVENQASASLLANVDVPEAILRLLLNETDVELVLNPPEGYDPEQQGEWDEETLTFAFSKPITLVEAHRERDSLTVVYDLANCGRWMFEIQPERVTIERV